MAHLRNRDNLVAKSIKKFPGNLRIMEHWRCRYLAMTKQIYKNGMTGTAEQL